QFSAHSLSKSPASASAVSVRAVSAEKLESGGRRVSLTVRAVPGAANRRRGGAQQQAAVLLQPPPQTTYLLQPAPFPVYQPLQLSGAQFPVSWALPQYIPQPQLSLQQTQQTGLKREVGEGVRRRRRKGVEREVGEGIVDCVLPDLVREIVNETISDIVFSYLSHQQSAKHAIPKPHPPSMLHPITSLLPPLPCRPSTQPSDLYRHGNKTVIGPRMPHPLLHLITHNNTEHEVLQYRCLYIQLGKFLLM
ncbi:hypothetical protein GBAR_LOCUS25069, partial [Geodia barretti]